MVDSLQGQLWITNQRIRQFYFKLLILYFFKKRVESGL